MNSRPSAPSPSDGEVATDHIMVAVAAVQSEAPRVNRVLDVTQDQDRVTLTVAAQDWTDLPYPPHDQAARRLNQRLLASLGRFIGHHFADELQDGAVLSMVDVIAGT